MKRRRLEARKSLSEIDKTLPRSKIEHTQCAGHRKTQPTGKGDPSAVVHQDQFGANHCGERNDGAFTFVQGLPQRIVPVAPVIWRDHKPSRDPRGPSAHCRWGTLMGKFFM